MADTDMRVEWRTIQAFPDYEISSTRIVRRRIADRRCWKAYPAGYVLSQWKSKNVHRSRDGKSTDNGRMMVTLYHGVKQSLLVSRLVCEAFHGMPPSLDHQAAHNNGNRLDDRSENLRWATAKENVSDQLIHGTRVVGELHIGSKLKEYQIYEIRNLISKGKTFRFVGKMYNISQSTYFRIRNGTSWRHLA